MTNTAIPPRLEASWKQTTVATRTQTIVHKDENQKSS